MEESPVRNIKLNQFVRKNASGEEVLDWSSFNSHAMDNIWEELLTSTNEIRLLLDGIEFISHESLVWIAFIGLFRSKKLLKTTITIPRMDAGQIDFLRKIKFREIKDLCGFGIEDEYLLEESSKKTKQESEYPNIEKIKYINKSYYDYTVRSNILDDLKKSIDGFLNIRQGEEQTHLKDFIIILNEIISNIIKHSGEKEFGGEGIISLKPPHPRSQYLTYCFSDIGNGFLSSLNQKHDLACTDEYDAILEGILFRFFNKQDQILGLYPTMELIRRKSGRLKIRSSNYYVKFDFSDIETQRKFDQGYHNRPSKAFLKTISTKYKMKFSLPGVHIYISLQV
jgi:hypothetical protein